MVRTTFTTLVPKVPDNDIKWLGFNKGGTLAYGTQRYNSCTKVKVYRASIFGGVHEIADIEFAYDGGFFQEIFYTQRQELVWLHPVDRNLINSLSLPLISSLVVFNVENGQLKRYYAEGDVTEIELTFMNAIDDIMVLYSNMYDTDINLFEVKLNDAHETFSMTLLVSVDYEEVYFDGFSFSSFCYYRDCVVIHTDPIGHNFNYLWCYHFQGKHWHLKNVLNQCVPSIKGQKPLWSFSRQFDGRLYNCILISLFNRIHIRSLTFDSATFTWKQVFMDTGSPIDPGYGMPQWLATSDGQTVCCFSTKLTTTAESPNVLKIVVHRQKMMPLMGLCLRALWPHVRQMLPQLQFRTDHEICRRLTLSSVLIADDYFGREFTLSL